MFRIIRLSLQLTFFFLPNRIFASPYGAGKSIAIVDSGVIAKQSENSDSLRDAPRIGGQLHLRKEVKHMPITLTVHIGRFTITICVKSRNRHSAK